MTMQLTDKQKALAWERLYRAETRGKIPKAQEYVDVDVSDRRPKVIPHTSIEPTKETFPVARFWRDPDGEWQLV